MTTTSPLPSGTRDDHFRLIQRGIEMAIERHGEAKPKDVVWLVLGWAVATIDGTPDRERGWLKSGARSSWRGPTGLTAAEAREINRIRVLSGIKNVSAAPLPTDRGEENALIALEWLKFLLPAKNGDNLRRAIVQLLRGDDRQRALALYRPGKRHDRQELWRMRERAFGLIQSGLLRRFGIDLRDLQLPAALAA